MNLGDVDLNLLVHLDVLLREQNVTKAAKPPRYYPACNE